MFDLAASLQYHALLEKIAALDYDGVRLLASRKIDLNRYDFYVHSSIEFDGDGNPVGPSGSGSNGEKSPLFAAIDRGDVEMVRLLIELGAHPHADQGMTHGSALGYAVATSSTAICDLLMEQPNMLETTYQDAEYSVNPPATPLAIAIGMNKEAIALKLLAKGARYHTGNAVDPHRKFNGTHISVFLGAHGMTEIVRQHPDIFTDPYHELAEIFMAAISTREHDLASYICEGPLEPRRTELYRDMIVLADNAAVEWMLEKRFASPHTMDSDQTPLEYTLSAHRASTLQVLLDHGAETNPAGRPPFAEWLEWQRPSILYDSLHAVATSHFTRLNKAFDALKTKWADADVPSLSNDARLVREGKATRLSRQLLGDKRYAQLLSEEAWQDRPKDLLALHEALKQSFLPEDQERFDAQTDISWARREQTAHSGDSMAGKWAGQNRQRVRQL